MKLVIDTFEGSESTPVVSHTFYGKTATEVNAIVKAHMTTDSFFRASMTTGNFRGIVLTNKMRWLK